MLSNAMNDKQRSYGSDSKRKAWAYLAQSCRLDISAKLHNLILSKEYSSDSGEAQTLKDDFKNAMSMSIVENSESSSFLRMSLEALNMQSSDWEHGNELEQTSSGKSGL